MGITFEPHPKNPKAASVKCIRVPTQNQAWASAASRMAQALGVPSGFLFYFTKSLPCPLGPFIESK